MSTAALAVGSVALARARASRRLHLRLGRSLADTTARITLLIEQMNDALDGLQRETQLSVALGEISSAGDLREMVERAAEAATHVCGAHAAVVVALSPEGERIVGATENAPNVSAAIGIEWPADGTRAMTFSFLHDPAADGVSRTGSGLAVPVGELPGPPFAVLVVLYEEKASISDRMLSDVETFAARAAPVIGAALSQHVDTPVARDPLTGLAARRQFHDVLAREVARARRHHTRLALVVLDVDRFRSVNERLGRHAADFLLITLATCIEAAAPPGAVPCRIGGDEFAIILPGSTRLDAEVVLGALDAERRDREPVRELTVVAGVAEVTPTDDATRLLERARRSLLRAKGGYARDARAGAHEPDEQT